MLYLAVSALLLVAILLVDRWQLWRECGRLLKRCEELQDEGRARDHRVLDRLFVAARSRPVSEPALDVPPSAQVQTADERAAFEDRVKEEMEYAAYQDHPMTRAEAQQRVWAMLGHSEPPMSLDD